MTAVAELDRDSDSSSATSSGVSASLGGPAVAAGGAQGEGDTPAQGRVSVAALPSEDQLLDVLYEVLAQGVPPRSKLTREEVERFLHQHARDRKPVSDFVAFFERYGLPIDALEYGADRELRELASGLQKERSSLIPGFGPSAEVPQPVAPLSASDFGVPGDPRATLTAPAFAVPPLVAAPLPLTAPSAATDVTQVEGEATGKRTFPSAPATEVAPAAAASKGTRWYLIAAAVLLALGLIAAAFAINEQRAKELEQRLDQARMQQRSTDEALTKLEQRAQSLQGDLSKNEADRRVEAALLESKLAAEKQQRASEEQAVERVLGPRYVKVRQKLVNEAAQNTPGIVSTSAPATTPTHKP